MASKIILYVDDDEDDRDLLSDAVLSQDPQTRIDEAKNGLEAINYLIDSMQTGNSLPCVIVLDLNMPFMDGRETFEKLKADPILTKVPVVILTTSPSPNDKAYFDKKGIELMIKPNHISYLDPIARSILQYCNGSEHRN
jgi:CheY-like chemotaxis protein